MKNSIEVRDELKPSTPKVEYNDLFCLEENHARKA